MAFNGANGFAKYLYGDEGDDKMWGSRNTEYEYMWGGEGDDVIYGGFGHMNQYLNGNEGDDIIYPGSRISVTDRVRGGKGDDMINPVVLEFDDAGMLTTDLTDRANQAVDSTAPASWQGGEGDDTIWGSSGATMDQVYEGGNGNDTIYAPYN